jgi:4-hydroxy-3-methylbut-2-en-1-yl diphosphate reductase
LNDGGRPAPSPSPDGATFVAAMRLEALAIGGKVLRTGMGHARAHAAAQALAQRIEPGAAVVLAGISGGLDPSLAPGEIVVATSVRGPDGDVLALSADDADAVATALRGAGRRVHLGPIVSSKTLVHGERRAELARTGALAVDMESAWVARALSNHRVVIVRLVADTAGNFVVGLVKGLVALRHVRAALDGWPGMPTPGAK